MKIAETLNQTPNQPTTLALSALAVEIIGTIMSLPETSRGHWSVAELQISASDYVALRDFVEQRVYSLCNQSSIYEKLNAGGITLSRGALEGLLVLIVLAEAAKRLCGPGEISWDRVTSPLERIKKRFFNSQYALNNDLKESLSMAAQEFQFINVLHNDDHHKFLTTIKLQFLMPIEGREFKPNNDSLVSLRLLRSSRPEIDAMFETIRMLRRGYIDDLTARRTISRIAASWFLDEEDIENFIGQMVSQPEDTLDDKINDDFFEQPIKTNMQFEGNKFIFSLRLPKIEVSFAHGNSNLLVKICNADDRSCIKTLTLNPNSMNEPIQIEFMRHSTAIDEPEFHIPSMINVIVLERRNDGEIKTMSELLSTTVQLFDPEKQFHHFRGFNGTYFPVHQGSKFLPSQSNILFFDNSIELYGAAERKKIGTICDTITRFYYSAFLCGTLQNTCLQCEKETICNFDHLLSRDAVPSVHPIGLVSLRLLEGQYTIDVENNSSGGVSVESVQFRKKTYIKIRDERGISRFRITSTPEPDLFFGPYVQVLYKKNGKLLQISRKLECDIPAVFLETAGSKVRVDNRTEGLTFEDNARLIFAGNVLKNVPQDSTSRTSDLWLFQNGIPKKRISHRRPIDLSNLRLKGETLTIQNGLFNSSGNERTLFTIPPLTKFESIDLKDGSQITELVIPQNLLHREELLCIWTTTDGTLKCSILNTNQKSSIELSETPSSIAFGLKDQNGFFVKAHSSCTDFWKAVNPDSMPLSFWQYHRWAELPQCQISESSEDLKSEISAQICIAASYPLFNLVLQSDYDDSQNPIVLKMNMEDSYSEMASFIGTNFISAKTQTNNLRKTLSAHPDALESQVLSNFVNLIPEVYPQIAIRILTNLMDTSQDARFAETFRKAIAQSFRRMTFWQISTEPNRPILSVSQNSLENPKGGAEKLRTLGEWLFRRSFQLELFDNGIYTPLINSSKQKLTEQQFSNLRCCFRVRELGEILRAAVFLKAAEEIIAAEPQRFRAPTTNLDAFSHSRTTATRNPLIIRRRGQ